MTIDILIPQFLLLKGEPIPFVVKDESGQRYLFTTRPMHNEVQVIGGKVSELEVLALLNGEISVNTALLTFVQEAWVGYLEGERLSGNLAKQIMSAELLPNKDIEFRLTKEAIAYNLLEHERMRPGITVSNMGEKEAGLCPASAAPTPVH